jgi:hypothetical protein
MIKTASFLQCLALTFGSALTLAYAECPTWEELLADESVIEVSVARRSSMFVAYVNPQQLGVCFMDEGFYNEVRENMIEPLNNRHFFWLGGGHSLDMADTALRVYMLQGDHEFFVDVAGKITGPRSFPHIHSEFLVSYEGDLDLSDGVTIFFRGFRGTYSNEYWLPEKYLPE